MGRVDRLVSEHLRTEPMLNRQILFLSFWSSKSIFSCPPTTANAEKFSQFGEGMGKEWNLAMWLKLNNIYIMIMTNNIFLKDNHVPDTNDILHGCKIWMKFNNMNENGNIRYVNMVWWKIVMCIKFDFLKRVCYDIVIWGVKLFR
jgi:hypothetical protein